MGSRNGWAAELAARCRAVGWEADITTGSGHWRVKTHEGKVFALASSSSDIHGRKNAERECARHGLEQLEQKMALFKAKERLERIEEDRKNGVDWDAEDRKREEEMAINKKDGDLGYVDDVAIAEIAPAMYKVKREGEVRREVPDVQELLLIDGTIKFRCDMDSDTGPCHKTAGSIQGVSMHQARTHTGKYQLKNKVVSNNVQRAIDKAKSTEKVVTVDKRGTVVDVKDVKPGPSTYELITDREPKAIYTESTENEVSELIEGQPGIVARLVTLASELDDLVDEASGMIDDMRELAESVRVKRNELRKLIAELPNHLMTDEVKEKLETYEQLRKMIK